MASTKGLLRLDPKSGAALTFLPWSADHEGDGPIAITNEAVWHSAGGHLYRINVATNQIDATYATDSGTVHPAIGFGSVWLANYERRSRPAAGCRAVRVSKSGGRYWVRTSDPLGVSEVL